MDIQATENERRLTQSFESDEREVMEEYNKRLEARQEVLEDHNSRLEEQLTKLRHFINQVELSTENMTRQTVSRKNRSRGLSGSDV